MNEYSEIVEKWKKLYYCYYYEFLPFFVIICHKFYKNKGKGNITAEEMKELILHYKNALNEYKKMLLEIDLEQAPHQKKYVYFKKKIQRFIRKKHNEKFIILEISFFKLRFKIHKFKLQ